MDEILLLKGLKNNDLQCFEYLVPSYSKRLFNFIYQMLHNKDAAEDLTQKDYLETANMDIFLYDIRTDKLSQITSDPSAQVNAQIWENYIVWQDNRNNTKVDTNP